MRGNISLGRVFGIPLRLHRATRIATKVGQGIAYALIAGVERALRNKEILRA